MFVGGGSGGIALLVLFLVFSFALRARRGGAWGGGGPWGGRSRGPYGGGPYGGGPYGGGPYGGGPSGQPGPPTSTGPYGQPTGSSGGWRPSGSGWPGDQPLGGPGAGAPTGGAAGTYAGDWMHDDRPAAASIPADLFPGRPSTASASPNTENPVEAGLDAIRAHDPNFNLDEFNAQVEKVFFIVQQAWSERDPNMSRQVMADQLWAQHRDRVQEYLNAHKRNMLDNLNVVNIWPVAAHSDQQRDTLTVRIVAVCCDYDVDDIGGRVLRGDRTKSRQWQEDWTFERSSAAQTQIGGPALGSKCPNCGAPLDVDLAGTCRYCKAPIMSGQYDWVLSRISQVG